MLYDERNREEVRQLEDDFFDWFETADADAFEDGTLDGFLEELEQADPLPGGFDPQKSLADFHQKYAAFLDPQKEEKRQNRLPRRAFFAVAAVAAVLASMVTAQAFGVDIFGFFGRWTDDVFTFTSSADKAGYHEQKRNYPLAEGESVTFPSLDVVLEVFDVDLPLVPQWFPERFGEFEVTGSVTPHGMEIFAITGWEDPEEASLSVHYTEFGSDGPSFIIEKDENPPITYESGGISHYLVTDHGICSATWIRDNIECIIGGTVTIEELKQIIDSIYLDKEKGVESSSSEDQKMHFDSIEEALEAVQFDQSLAPKWLPERFGKLEVIVSVLPVWTSVYAIAESDQGDNLSISYCKDAGGQPGSIIEKDANPPVLYESGGVLYYLLTDHDWRDAVGMQGDIQCIIGGNITEEEIKQIIDSIYS